VSITLITNGGKVYACIIALCAMDAAMIIFKLVCPI